MKNEMVDDRIAESLHMAVNAYVAAPTLANHQHLIDLAQTYRERWIEAHADRPPRQGRHRAVGKTRRRAQPRHEVTQFVYEIPVMLVLHERCFPGEEDPRWMLGWRTRYSPRGPTRRYYLTKNGCWKVPAKVALDMIQLMEGRGGLSAEFDDHRASSQVDVAVSLQLTQVEKQAVLEEITGLDEDWGPDPFFVVTSHRDNAWKKALLINPRDNSATFRSLTSDRRCTPKKALREGTGWWLDNAMTDVSVQDMRVFYEFLAVYCEQADHEPYFAPE
ncbi:MAG: hypothetical protein WD928_10265 [Gammaproteobacteria bacterium]